MALPVPKPMPVCPQLGGADITAKKADSGFDPNVWSGRAVQEVFVDPG